VAFIGWRDRPLRPACVSCSASGGPGPNTRHCGRSIAERSNGVLGAFTGFLAHSQGDSGKEKRPGGSAPGLPGRLTSGTSWPMMLYPCMARLSSVPLSPDSPSRVGGLFQQQSAHCFGVSTGPKRPGDVARPLRARLCLATVRQLALKRCRTRCQMAMAPCWKPSAYRDMKLGWS
jgi:hypothetical protein